MTFKIHPVAAGAAVLLLAVTAGCDLREPAASAPADVEPSIAGPAAAVPVPVARDEEKVAQDASRLEALRIGLAAVEGRIIKRDAAYMPVDPLPDHRLLLHPGEGKRARVILDIAGLRALDLHPVIESFEGNTTCMADPQAGLAGLHWRIDGGKAHDVEVDRHHAEVIHVETNGGRQLIIESSDLNGVIWCDWLAVGFTDVSPS